MQERWADEHGLKDWERPHPGIILRQIEHYKPDILWIHALSKIPILLRLNLKKYFPFIKAIIGFAVDDPKYANMKDLDLLLCDSDIVCTRAKEAGINAKILYNGFDDSILNIIDPIKFSKQDRIYEMAGRFKLPLILFSEGGGGRPGDDDTGPRVAADTHTFTQFSQLSGLVPMVGINHGRCFAGNTALLACCDVIIASATVN